jgi:hypothetical protein
MAFLRFPVTTVTYCSPFLSQLHRVTDDPRGSLDLAGLGVERLELAIHDTGKHEIARRHQGR